MAINLFPSELGGEEALRPDGRAATHVVIGWPLQLPIAYSGDTTEWLAVFDPQLAFVDVAGNSLPASGCVSPRGRIGLRAGLPTPGIRLLLGAGSTLRAYPAPGLSLSGEVGISTQSDRRGRGGFPLFPRPNAYVRVDQWVLGRHDTAIGLFAGWSFL